MSSFKQKLFTYTSFFCCLWLFSGIVSAQEISFNYFYKLELANATEPPKVGGFDFDYPEEARKNGVEGTLKAALTLGEDGKARDITISQTLPHGVAEAVVKALQNLSFQPAKNNSQPVPVKMNFDFVVTAVYRESDKNITKPKILGKPEAIYPANQVAEKIKGVVQVSVMFFTDGTVKILGVSSVMPKEFDKSAAEAAAQLKFQPAVHKKSKKPVSQQMIVEYDFKP
jgi:TonB family protein